MKLTRIVRHRTFQTVWLILSLVLGVAGILSGALEALHGTAGMAAAGVVGGAVIVLIGCIGLWGLRRRTHSSSA